MLVIRHKKLFLFLNFLIQKMDTLIQIAQILFILSVLVILHEFGHFLPARLFKVRVEKFYLFMDVGFSVFKKKIKDTEWGLGWLPIGGYVKLSGMIDESMDAKQMELPAQPWEFRSKPAWQRLIIMLGGVTVNIILAWFIFTILFATIGQKYIATEKAQENGLMFSKIGLAAGFQNGDKIISVDGKEQEKFNRLIIDVLLGSEVQVLRNGKLETIVITNESKAAILGEPRMGFMQHRLQGARIDSIIPKSEAQKIGLQKGDAIVKINDKEIRFFDELSTSFEQNKDKTVSLTINRNDKQEIIQAKISKDGKLGFQPKFELKEDLLVVKKMGFAAAIPAAIKESYVQFVYNIKQFKLILQPKTGAYKQVKSPIGMTQMLPTEWDWEVVFSFMAVLSVGLAFMNLLPIPGLDGAHALFTIAEMITGKTLSVKTAERVQTVGMLILFSIMILTFGKDIYEIIANKFF
jgi:regulator of sigma E protease